MDLFDMDSPSPFMTITYPVRSKWREKLGAVTHVDGTARVQTVSRDTNPRFHSLVREFGALSSVPVVLNTSFNRHGISTISSPRQAIEHLFEECIDVLFLENYKINKNKHVQKKFMKYFSEEKLLKKHNLKWFNRIKKLINKKQILIFKKNYEKKYKKKITM